MCIKLRVQSEQIEITREINTIVRVRRILRLKQCNMSLDRGDEVGVVLSVIMLVMRVFGLETATEFISDVNTRAFSWSI